jgi:hypothetical protein
VNQDTESRPRGNAARGHVHGENLDLRSAREDEGPVHNLSRPAAWVPR